MNIHTLFFNHLRLLAHLCAWLVIFLGCVVVYGWIQNIPAIIQIHPTFAPMQFNSAGLFVLGGISVLCYLWGARALSCFVSILGFSISLLIICQYFFVMDFGIDELFFKATITTRASAPGRIAINTAFCFNILALSLFMMSIRNWPSSNWFVGFTGTVGGTFGFLSTYGYVFSLEKAYTWNDLVDMGLHTSLGLIILSVAILMLALLSLKRFEIKPWLYFNALIFSMISCLTFIQGLFSSSQRNIHLISGISLKGIFVVISYALTLVLIGYIAKKYITDFRGRVQSQYAIDYEVVSESSFLCYFAHEIKNPLNSVLNFARMMAQELEPVEKKEYFSALESAGTHLIKLIDDVIIYSKHEANKLEANIQVTPVQEWLSQIEVYLQGKANVDRRNFSICVDPCLPKTLSLDGRKVAQIIFNLVDNSFKNTDPALPVELKIGFADGDLVIDVLDKGRGIPSEQIDKIFMLFHQVDEKRGGYGVGLALCKAYVELFEGDIHVESHEGKGSWFKVTIPCRH